MAGTDFDIRVSPSTRVPPTETPKPVDDDFPVPDHKATSRPRGLKEILTDRRSRGEDEANSDGGRAGGPRDRRTKQNKSAAAPRMPAQLGKQVAELYGLAAMMLMAFDPPCATAVMESAERCGEAWENLARTNPGVRRVLVSLTQGSAWSSVVFANAPIISAIAIHHIPAVSKIMQRRFDAPDDTGDAGEAAEETSQGADGRDASHGEQAA
jgi:hypothetical protein